MWYEQLAIGIMIGLLASVPLGPVGVVAIQRTLSKSQRSGFVSGLGSAVTDIFFAGIALFSLKAVMGFIEHHAPLIKVMGGICIVIVGTFIFIKNPVIQIRRNRAGKRDNLWSDFLSGLLITLANPAFILIFVALFATFGVSYERGSSSLMAGVMLLGVVLGGALWWLGLTVMISLLRGRFRPRHLLWINRISGALIIILGAAAILTVFINIPINGIMP